MRDRLMDMNYRVTVEAERVEVVESPSGTEVHGWLKSGVGEGAVIFSASLPAGEYYEVDENAGEAGLVTMTVPTWDVEYRFVTDGFTHIKTDEIRAMDFGGYMRLKQAELEWTKSTLDHEVYLERTYGDDWRDQYEAWLRERNGGE